MLSNTVDKSFSLMLNYSTTYITVPLGIRSPRKYHSAWGLGDFECCNLKYNFNKLCSGRQSSGHFYKTSSDIIIWLVLAVIGMMTGGNFYDVSWGYTNISVLFFTAELFFRGICSDLTIHANSFFPTSPVCF